jgi:hypothetical protein
MRPFAVVTVLTALTVAGVSARACDSASCALVTRGQSGVFPRGGGRIDLSMRYVDDGARLSPDGTVDEVVRPKIDFENGVLIPGYHRETGGYEAFLQLDGGYGLTDRLSIVATIPLIVQRSFDHLHPVPGAPLRTFPFRAEGFGDVWLGARYAPAHNLAVGLSLKTPTGSYRMLGDFDGSIQDPTLQPGTGSFDLLGTAQCQTRAGGIDATLSGSYLRTSTNGLEYRFGDESIVAASVGRRAFGRTTASLQLKGHHRDRSLYRDAGVPSTGETSLHIVPGLRYDMPDRSSVYAFVQVPLYRRVNEQQLASRASLLLGFAKAF